MSKLIMIQEQKTTKKNNVKLKSFFQRFTKKKLIDETPSQLLHNELRSLQRLLELKETNFIYAETEYIDVAIMELEAIRTKYSITVRQLKELNATNVI
ncbi:MULTISPECIES: hypothetical protein [unclassified Bacillus (in: firmicutes)]|uniref:hypothetical protein n=1 Tax=unclassified Bacillus (in: firmicutes) TaxID=185979 RepID=UPI000BEF2541|nr:MULTISPECIES: hypothetical protein [unclassified Bacillus (in: firmicutes)]PEJ57460.1 hypothetical protein CN692_12340 [Bacillus sp. AFS002410]PEL12501.1 hypothetical protein CN601_07640 [Bacillus sp. AFS017336]